MSERRYYSDAYTTAFEAQIVERFKLRDRLAVILDQTYFYPASGGQPCDLGSIQGTEVVNVFVRDTDKAIVHVVDGEIWSNEVQASVAWPRRFDHMQQHTGQHILSQAFLRVAEADTISFHLGNDSVTIDLDPAELSSVQVEKAEGLANKVIWENRPVRAFIIDRERVGQLQIRKAPEIDGPKLRLIEIKDFDLTACGGTHVAHTGEVGLLKIVKLERRKDILRVDFRCGRRALLDYRQKNSIVNRLTSELTTGLDGIGPTVARLQEESKQSRRLLRQQLTRLLGFEASYFLENAHNYDKATIVSHIFEDRDPTELRLLANHIAEKPGSVALLGLAGPSSQLIFARADDGPGEMNKLIKPALQILGSAAGGGSPSFAQGGGPAADRERVAQALSRAEKLLLGQMR